MGSEGEEQSQHKDRRKKRTSSSQYLMYIEMMEDDAVFASGRLTRDLDINYLPKKWKELAIKLNSCSTGPKLTAEEWRKRLNDWKNTTRCKYRRSISGEKDVNLTALELKALDLFGKTAPATNQTVDQLSIHLKEEKLEEENEQNHQRGSDTLQKQLQAVVDEAIGDNENDDEEEDVLQDDPEEHELFTVPITTSRQTQVNDAGGGGSVNRATNASTNTTYRTIVVENAGQFTDDDNGEEFISHRRATATTSGATVQAVVTTSAPNNTVTKLINGEIPMKRLRSQAPEQIIYEVKKAPITQRTITVHNTPTTTQYQTVHHQQQPQHRTIEVGSTFTTAAVSPAITQGITSQDAREVSRQLKRLADIKAEKLKFDIARFKFNNPGFHFNCHF